jgi:hypothetical protein
MAVLALPSPNSGVAMLASGCRNAQRVALFLDANATGVMYRPTLQHQQDIKTTTRPTESDKGEGIHRIPRRHWVMKLCG